MDGDVLALGTPPLPLPPLPLPPLPLPLLLLLLPAPPLLLPLLPLFMAVFAPAPVDAARWLLLLLS